MRTSERIRLPSSRLRITTPSTTAPKTRRAILDKLAAVEGEYALAKARLAAIDYTEGRAADAHKILDELLKREPHSRIALILKGRLLLLAKKPDEALVMAKTAVAAEPERAAEGQFLMGPRSISPKGASRKRRTRSNRH